MQEQFGLGKLVTKAAKAATQRPQNKASTETAVT